MNLDDIFDLGHQDSGEGGEWVPTVGLCVTCARVATRGSWCDWHHPSGKWVDGDVLTVEELSEAIAELWRHIGRRHG